MVKGRSWAFIRFRGRAEDDGDRLLSSVRHKKDGSFSPKKFCSFSHTNAFSRLERGRVRKNPYLEKKTKGRG